MYLDSEKKKEIFGMLDYLMRKDINRYRALIAKKELGIRK